MVARQLGAVARYESELRSARVKSAKQALAAGGKFAGGRRPFGWEVDGITAAPREAEAIETASKDVLRGTSITEIARRWNADELPTITGKRWVGQTVRGILLRPRNAGLRTHRGHIVGAAEWKHIVDPETWHALRRHLDDPNRRTQRGTEPRHLGTKRYRCGSLLPEGDECGDTLRVGNYGNDRQKAYRCNAPTRDGLVQHVSINQDALDEYVVRKLINGAIEQGATTSDETRSPEPTSDVHELESAQAALAEELAAGRLPVAAWQAANAQLAQRLNDLQVRAADAAGAEVVSRALGDFELDPWGTWERWDLGQRREFMDNHVTVTVLPAHSRKPADLLMEKRVRLDWKWETGE